MKKISFLLFLIIFNLSFAQNNYNSTQFFSEGKDLLSSPFHWEADDFLILGLSSAAAYGAVYLDKDIKSQIQTTRSETTSFPILLGRLYGEPLTPLILGSIYLVSGNSTGNEKNKKIGFEFLQTTAYSVGLTIILKYIFGRERPTTTDDPFLFDPISFRNNDFLSFPSGHTTIAFALSTVISENVDNDFLKIAVYLPAFWTGYTRMYENRHWFSDVIFGAVIGYTTAKFLTGKHKTNNQLVTEEPAQLFNITIPLN